MTTRPRLPQMPALDWKPDGTPVATDMDDVYFSVEDGLAETRAVFLAGCGLPERWAGREHFTVAELGFGTGLNLLALWQIWAKHRPSPDARLDFVSFEGFPLTRAQAEQALARWPELAPLSQILLSRWPARARGVQHIPLGDGLSLILHVDEVSEALANSAFKADAWFLDGFAPAKNEGMWAPALYPMIHARSAPGAWIGTYTVAGAVRRGLVSAGFAVSKEPGFGRKRDRLKATLPETADRVQRTPPQKTAVIGGGIAGVSAARSFAARGSRVTLFDRAEKLGTGASGNRLALLMPRLDAGDTSPARALIAGYLQSLATYRDLPGATLTDVIQKPRSADEQARFEKLMADPPLPLEFLSALPGGGLRHHQCLILQPEILLPALLGEGVSLSLGTAPEVDLTTRTVNGECFDAIILANGMGLSGFEETAWLALAPRLGQVELAQADTSLTQAVAAGHYALALGKERLWGATFEATELDAPVISVEAQAKNLEVLSALVSPDWAGHGTPTSRAGIRATTLDKMPIAGRAPDYAQMLETHAGLRHGRVTDAPVPTHEGVWMLGGFGARGFTFGPWLGAAIVAEAFGEAALLGMNEAQIVSPERFILRALKRREV